MYKGNEYPCGFHTHLEMKMSCFSMAVPCMPISKPLASLSFSLPQVFNKIFTLKVMMVYLSITYLKEEFHINYI